MKIWYTDKYDVIIMGMAGWTLVLAIALPISVVAIGIFDSLYPKVISQVDYAEMGSATVMFWLGLLFGKMTTAGYLATHLRRKEFLEKVSNRKSEAKE